MSARNPFWISAQRHAVKIVVLVVNFVLNRRIVLRLIGLTNKKWNYLSSVFLVYPASEAFASAYTYVKHRETIRWQPLLIGAFRQNGKWGITFGISSIEQDFFNPANVDNLRALVARMEHIRVTVAAQQKTFAGILPGILHKNGLIRDTVEAEVTVEAVKQAETLVRNLERYPSTTPLIILGSRGFIGRRLVSRLVDRTIYEVDIADNETDTWPHHLCGEKAILINLTRKAAINNYLKRFWPALVLLNEVYPPRRICYIWRRVDAVHTTLLGLRR